MTEQKPLINFQDYVAIGLRRKWYIIIPFVLSVLVSFGVYKNMPKIYKSTTLILVQPQRIPENYIRPTITESVTDRLYTISQEILSRTRLEDVIQEFNLFSELKKSSPMEVIIEIMRKKIDVQVQRGGTQNTFTISYESTEPRTVMLVTNKLASLFIAENLRVREMRVENASDFLSHEVQDVGDQLKRKENEMRLFKERNMGQLPQQLDANLRILERLQQQVQTVSENLRSAEDRSILLQNQVDQIKQKKYVQIELSPPAPAQEPRKKQTSKGVIQIEPTTDNQFITQMNSLKSDLANAKVKYTESHPDIISLKKKIANLEPKVREIIEKQEAERESRLKESLSNEEEIVEEKKLPARVALVADPASEKLLTQYTKHLNDTQSDIRRFQEETKGAKELIAQYQKRIEETPKREQEMVLLTRDYELLRANYQSLVEKKIQAQMAENLERKQQGEQFKILDLARLPEKPVKPNRDKILLMGVVIGLVSGLGLAWFRENLDQSFHTVSDIENVLEIPVLATIPNLNKEEKKAA